MWYSITNGRNIPTTILFDNDGVLVDTEHLYFRATADVLRGVGIELQEEEYRQYFLVEGTGVWPRIQARGYSDEQISGMRRERNEKYSFYLAQSDIAIPGVKDVLVRLYGRVKMGVVTSSKRDHFEQIHNRTGFRRYFDFVVAEGDYTHSKPHPEPYLKALERGNVRAGDCLVIEDSLRGLQSAKAAGFECWVIPRGLTRSSDFSQADRVLGKLSEILTYLKLEKERLE